MTDSDEQRIVRLEAERYGAMVDGDWATFARLCHPELIYTHSTGSTDTLDSYLAHVTAGLTVYHRINHPIEKVVILADVACVLGSMIADITAGGADKSLRNKSLAVWVRSDSDWRFVAFAPTALT